MTDRPPPIRRYLTKVDWLAIDVGGSIPTTVSPADRSAFLADLAARVPHLRREGEALVSRTA